MYHICTILVNNILPHKKDAHGKQGQKYPSKRMAHKIGPTTIGRTTNTFYHPFSRLFPLVVVLAAGHSNNRRYHKETYITHAMRA
jgi:hypothetical protein